MDLGNGAGSQGQLIVTNGGKVVCDGISAFNSSILVSGTNSTIDGFNGISDGTALIEHGGKASGRYVSSVGAFTTNSMLVTVTGPGSEWHSAGRINVGDVASKTATLVIEDHGLVSTPNGLNVGAAGGTDADLSINSGGIWEPVGPHSRNSPRPMSQTCVLSSRCWASHFYTSNYLLQHAYLTAPEVLAEEAMSLLVTEPERLSCGFSDNAFWISRCLIEKCSSHCSQSTFEKLEAILLNYTTPYERSKDALKVRGRASFNLLSALSPQRRSRSATARFEELGRKFGAPDHRVASASILLSHRLQKKPPNT